MQEALVVRRETNTRRRPPRLRLPDRSREILRWIGTEAQVERSTGALCGPMSPGLASPAAPSAR